MNDRASYIKMLEAEVSRLRLAQSPPRSEPEPTCAGCSATYWRGYGDAETYFWRQMGDHLADQNTEYWAALSDIAKTAHPNSRAYETSMTVLKKFGMEPT